MDGEIQWRTGGEEAKAQAGQYHIWLRFDYFAFILPEWTLSVDDRPCPRCFYLQLEPNWYKISLAYRADRFDFLFEDRKGMDTPLPVPAGNYHNGDGDQS
jgi:hypothetical protein